MPIQRLTAAPAGGCDLSIACLAVDTPTEFFAQYVLSYGSDNNTSDLDFS